MAEELGLGEQAFVQAMMSRAYTTVAEARELAKAALAGRADCTNRQMSDEAFDELHRRVNQALEPFDLQLRAQAVHSKRYMAIVNLAKDDAAKTARSCVIRHDKPAELAFFRALLELLCSSANAITSGVPYSEAVHAQLQDSSSDGTDEEHDSLVQQVRELREHDRERIVRTLVDEGWLDEACSSNGQNVNASQNIVRNVRLGPRAMLELESELTRVASEDAAQQLGWVPA